VADVCHVLLRALFATKLKLTEDALSFLDDFFNVSHQSFEIAAFAFERREAVLFGKMLLTDRRSAKKTLVWMYDFEF
jgi:phosphoribosyl 1,2-cyclic phosphodiesterase